MLTADAFGILPPIARLTRDQAMFYFLSGYTAKVAGTELGVTEPQATFSTCFGAPFLPQEPGRLRADARREAGRPPARERLARQHRLDRRAVRRGAPDADRAPRARCCRAALEEGLRSVEYRLDPVFGFEVPVSVPGIDDALLDPRSTWSDPEAYDRKARELARMFRDNFEKFAESAGRRSRRPGRLDDPRSPGAVMSRDAGARTETTEAMRRGLA